MSVAILWISAAIATTVCAAMLYSVATFHDASGEQTFARQRSIAIEVLWTLIPILIMVSALVLVWTG
jgi:heme/copper-type cytochrome/quinol oxidase subunit 2